MEDFIKIIQNETPEEIISRMNDLQTEKDHAPDDAQIEEHYACLLDECWVELIKRVGLDETHRLIELHGEA